MTEYFLSSFVFNALGDEVALTLETDTSKLELPAIVEPGYSKNPRIDLVIYKNRIPPIQHKENLFALVEFKTGSVWEEPTEKKPKTDRRKLIAVLKHIRTVTYGVICGRVWGEERRKNSDDYSRSAGNWPFWRSIEIEGTTELYFFGVSVFTAESVAQARVDRAATRRGRASHFYEPISVYRK